MQFYSGCRHLLECAVSLHFRVCIIAEVFSYALLLSVCTLNSSAGVRPVCQAYKNKAHGVFGLTREVHSEPAKPTVAVP